MIMWRFFPVLVKEEILKHMDLMDKLSLSKCSKNTRNLLYCIPNHLKRVSINEDGSVRIDENQVSTNDFYALIYSRQSTIFRLKLKAHIDQDKIFLTDMIEQFEKSQKILKVERLIMDINAEYAELYKKVVNICDPSVVSYMNFHQLYSMEMYRDIVQTPHWRNCTDIDFNSDSPSAKSEITYANIDDFSHFKTIYLGVPTFSTGEAWNLIQKYPNHIDYHFLEITTLKSIKKKEIDWKIENQWQEVTWRTMGIFDSKYILHPTKPRQVFGVEIHGSRFRATVMPLRRFQILRGHQAR